MTTAAQKKAAAAKKKAAAAKKAAAKQPVIYSDLAAKYGWAEAVIKSDPTGSLTTLFNNAVKHKWTDEKFAAKLKTTAWYKGHSDSARQMINLKYSDKATYSQRLAQEKQNLKYAAAALGAQVDDGSLNNLAEASLMGGWDDAQKQATLAGYVDVMSNGSSFFGKAGEIEQSLRKVAHDNGQNFSDDFFKSAVKQTMAGAPVEQFQQQIRDSAASMYGAWADRIKAGQNVIDLASPYVNSMKQILEIPDSQLDLSDATLNKALKAQMDNGQPTTEPLWKFEQTLRQDPRWMKTKDSAQQYGDMLNNIKSSWGFMSHG